MSWDTVSPGYRPLSWGYPGILRMLPVSHDANLRFQTMYIITKRTQEISTLFLVYSSLRLPLWRGIHMYMHREGDR